MSNISEVAPGILACKNSECMRCAYWAEVKKATRSEVMAHRASSRIIAAQTEGSLANKVIEGRSGLVFFFQKERGNSCPAIMSSKLHGGVDEHTERHTCHFGGSRAFVPSRREAQLRSRKIRKEPIMATRRLRRPRWGVRVSACSESEGD